MKRRVFAILMALIGIVHLLDGGAACCAADTAPARPNIVWIVSEDNGPFLGCYGHPDADTPHLDRLAAEGILYRRAFANAPVCAPSRFTIITGQYAPSCGTHHMRSTNYVPPHRAPFFVSYLRDANYFCTNHSKTDYNLRPVQRDTWNQMTKGDHRQRAAGQPFFAVYNLGTSHESSLHRPIDESLHDAPVQLPPYHPDTPILRASWAKYHQIVTRMDAEVGKLLQQLDDEGVADDTIVFYYADHAGILPRSKRFLYDSGVHVPLIVRFGKNVRHLDPREPGATTDELVSLVDLAPTVLSLAGVSLPNHLQGQAFLGTKKAPPREYVHLFRGRMDEFYDMSRAVRDARFKYIVHYQPHLPWGLPLQYLRNMPAFNAWRALHEQGKTNELQSRFWRAKPFEELYNLEADPFEVNNLTADPAHAETLTRLRAANRAHLLRTHDAGFLPEAMMVRLGEQTGSIYALVRDEQKYPLESLLDAAELAAGGDAARRPELAALLEAEHPGLRYWGAVGFVVQGRHDAEAGAHVAERLHALLANDPFDDVRIAAAEALLAAGDDETALAEIGRQLSNRDGFAALQAANVAETLGDRARPLLPQLRAARQGKHEYVPRVLNYTVPKLDAADKN